MRWRGGRRSSNIEDRRGRRRRRGLAGGGIGTLLLVLAALYFGIDPNVVMQGLQTVETRSRPAESPGPGPTDEQADFVAVVLQVGRLSAARCRLPAVEEEDFHRGIVADATPPPALPTHESRL